MRDVRMRDVRCAARGVSTWPPVPPCGMTMSRAGRGAAAWGSGDARRDRTVGPRAGEIGASAGRCCSRRPFVAPLTAPPRHRPGSVPRAALSPPAIPAAPVGERPSPERSECSPAPAKIHRERERDVDTAAVSALHRSSTPGLISSDVSALVLCRRGRCGGPGIRPGKSKIQKPKTPITRQIRRFIVPFTIVNINRIQSRPPTNKSHTRSHTPTLDSIVDTIHGTSINISIGYCPPDQRGAKWTAVQAVPA